MPDSTLPSPSFPSGGSEISFQSHFAEEHKTDYWKNLLLVLPFLLFFFVQLAHHQMWRDELHTWGLLRASPTLTSLFGNIHYEGHPTLWYLLLWPAARWTSSPGAMKLIEAVIGTAIYLIIGLWSPFSRVEKALLLLSYFISFEYTVISRDYSLFLLAALAYVHVRSARPSSPIAAAILLGILANTVSIGVILSVAFVSEWICNRISQGHHAIQPSRWRYYAAAGIYLFSLAIYYQSTRLAKDISIRATGPPFQFAASLRHLAFVIQAYTVVPFIPFHITATVYWNAPIFNHHRLLLPLVPIVVIAIYLLFRRDRCLLLLIGLAAAGGIALSHLIYLGYTRHFGIVFVAIVAALWIQRFRTHHASIGVYLLLGIFALGGVTVAIAQWTRPFSNAGATARWIQQHDKQHVPIVGTPDTSLDGIAQDLQRPVYFLDCSCTDTFMRFSNRRDNFDESQVPSRLKLAAVQLHAPEMILIKGWPLKAAEVDSIRHESLEVTPLTAFTGAAAPAEDFYLYKVVADSSAKIPIETR